MGHGSAHVDAPRLLPAADGSCCGTLCRCDWAGWDAWAQGGGASAAAGHAAAQLQVSYRSRYQQRRTPMSEKPGLCAAGGDAASPQAGVNGNMTATCCRPSSPSAAPCAGVSMCASAAQHAHVRGAASAQELAGLLQQWWYV
jgi:hypothetical protein